MAKYRLCSGFAMAPEKDMKMLQSMSKKGWHLKGMKGMFLYEFEKGEPHEYQYALNLEMDVNEEMLSMYKASGWTPIVAATGAQIYRAEVGTTPIFSDKVSELEMLESNRGFCGKWAVVFALFLVAALLLANVMQNIVFDIIVLPIMVAFIFTFMPFVGFQISIAKLKKKQ